jgi:hypothetical protein
MILMQVACAAFSSASRVARLGFTLAGSGLSSVVTGVVVVWLWWSNTAPIQSAPAHSPLAKGSRTTQPGETGKGASQQPEAGADGSTISGIGPSGCIGSAACGAVEPLQAEHEADEACGSGGEDADEGMDAYVSPLGSCMRVSSA